MKIKTAIKNYLARRTPHAANSRGFSFVELIIVIAVIAILAAAGITILDPLTQFQKAQDSKRKSDLSQLQKALDAFYQDNGRYPNAVSYKIEKLDDEDVGIEWGTAWLPYMAALPKDPASSKNFVYHISPNGQSYYIYASLDRGDDSQACNSGNACSSLASNNIAENACGGICNYGVSSSNVSP